MLEDLRSRRLAPPPIKAAIFDMDGLLFDTEVRWWDTYKIVGREHGFEIDEATRLEMLGGTQPVQFLIQRFGLTVPPDDLRREVNLVFQRLLIEQVDLMPGARDLVEELSEYMPLGVASNARTSHSEDLLARFG